MFGSDLFIRRTTLCSKDLQQNKAEHGSQDVNGRQTNGDSMVHSHIFSSEQNSAAVIIKSLQELQFHHS